MADVTQDDLDLDFYESKRKQVIQSITKDGKIPQDKESVDLLLKAIDGGSRVILAKKRLEVDKEGNQIKGEQQAIVQELLRSMPTKKQQLARKTPLAEVTVVVPKPGETDIGTKQLSYEQIMSSEGRSSQTP